MKKELRLIADSSPSNQCVKLAEWLAVPMFCLSLLFLAILAGLTVVWVDMAAPAHLPAEADLAVGVTDESISDAFLSLQKSACLGRLCFVRHADVNLALVCAGAYFLSLVWSPKWIGGQCRLVD